MNKRTLQSIYVGLTAILGFVLISYSIIWLGNKLKFGRSTHYKVIFRDAKGLTQGAGVQMSGVDVGSVDGVSLTHGVTVDGKPVPDNLAQLDVTIDSGYHVPQGSAFVIKSPLIGNTLDLVVEPNPKGGAAIPDGTTVLGSEHFGIENLVEEAQPLLKESQPLMKKIDQLTEKVILLTDVVTKTTQDVADVSTRKDLKRTVHNLAITTDSLPKLLDQTTAQLNSLSAQTHSILSSVDKAAVSGQQVASNAAGLTNDLRATLNENRAGLKTLIRNANDTTSSLALLTSNLSNTIGNKDIQRSLVSATENLADVTAKLNATADDLNRLSSDPRLSEDIRGTVSTFRETAENLRETSNSIKNIAARVETIHIPGERRAPSPGTGTRTSSSSEKNARRSSPSDTSLLEPGLVFNSVYDTTVSRLRVDTDFTLLTGGRGSFYRAGLYDLTYGNRIDLVAGISNGYPARTDLRYGIIAGKLGMGTDLRTGPLDLRLDIYDPNSLTVNARAKTSLSADTSLLIGLDSIGSGRYSNRATIGVQIRK